MKQGVSVLLLQIKHLYALKIGKTSSIEFGKTPRVWEPIKRNTLLSGTRGMGSHMGDVFLFVKAL